MGKTVIFAKATKTGGTCKLLRAVRSVMGWQRNLNGECDRIPARKSWKCMQMLQHVLGYLMLSLLLECHWSRLCDANNSMGPWAAGAPKKPEDSCNFYLQLGRLKLVQFSFNFTNKDLYTNIAAPYNAFCSRSISTKSPQQLTQKKVYQALIDKNHRITPKTQKVTFFFQPWRE